MIRKQVSVLLVLGLSVAGCSKDSDGELVTPDPVAGLRYVNVVPDTGAMDIRVIDIVGNAPNTVNATFRTSGQPFGITTTSLPQHTAVLAGSRQIRAFMTGTTIAIASTVMLDTTVTFDAGKNYTVYLWGYARTGSTPSLRAMVVLDSVPTMTATQFAIRTVHLAPTVAPTLATAGIDVFVDTLAAAAAPVGTPTFAGVLPGDVRAYVLRTTRTAVTGPPAVPALNYRALMTATGTLAPFVQVDVPNGTVGTSTVNPIAGDLVGGGAVTAIIVPPSVAGSAATAFATPSILYIVDQRPPRTAP